MTHSPVVSILTPVYNGEEFLDECIRSVLSQTYPHWEYVIVDNVSSDHTAQIAQSYAKQDSRIRVVRATEFLDIYGNHNRALRAMGADSRYCKFVQADDWLYPECIERMVDVAERYPAVGIVSAFGLNGKRVDLDGLFPYGQEAMSGRDALRELLLGNWGSWVVGGPTSVLLRADLVRRHAEFYDRSIWHADTAAAFRELLSSDLGFVHQVLTFMRGDNPRGLTSFSWRVYSFLPMEGRMVIRFGPSVLSPTEYRARIRRWIGSYGWWLMRESLKPRRHRQREFHDFHAREIEAMICEAGHDRETRVELSMLRRLLRSTTPQPAPNRS